MLALRFSTRELKTVLDPGLDDTSSGLNPDLEPVDTESGVGLGLEATRLLKIVSSLAKAGMLSSIEGS